MSKQVKQASHGFVIGAADHGDGHFVSIRCAQSPSPIRLVLFTSACATRKETKTKPDAAAVCAISTRICERTDERRICDGPASGRCSILADITPLMKHVQVFRAGAFVLLSLGAALSRLRFVKRYTRQQKSHRDDPARYALRPSRYCDEERRPKQSIRPQGCVNRCA